MRLKIAVTVITFVSTAFAQTPPAKWKKNPLRNAYFGDLHTHTGWSPDAFALGVRTTPDDAYRFSRGEAVMAMGRKVQLRGAPYDFQAVTEHSEYLGVFPRLANPNDPLSKSPAAAQFTSSDPEVQRNAFVGLVQIAAGKRPPIAEFITPEVRKGPWQEIIRFADKYYVPGKFTTFAGYEWTSHPDNQNLHRNVIFEDTKNLPEMPFTSFDSNKPEDLWNFLERQRERGLKVIAISHNANVSNGLMYALKDSSGKPLDADYAARRMRNEPLTEISQIKGTSDTHPALSPNDEFANFEIYTDLLGLAGVKSKIEGSYVREALRNGVGMQERGGFNPFKFGLIGSSDTHAAAIPREENNYFGHAGVLDDTPQKRLSISNTAALQAAIVRSSGAVAGVWAEENTRESIHAALRRKETFGTTGPLIRVRFFGGWNYAPGLERSSQWIKTAYDKGVPMGSDLPRQPERAKAPVFLVWAVKDPADGNLDRIQIIKGWSKDGKTYEKIFDVALSGGRKPGPDGKVPPVGNTVDAKKATYTNTIGATELKAEWSDPEFDATAPSFYYVRVLQIPTPRWSTYDSVAAGIPLPEGIPAAIQERAWASPIWYVPKSN